ncbi:MAG: hypothetical protein HYV35_06010 [Lentisphaerae bacterium]|nr:hypothetical protein [Lentisphaerota bacterium]
MSVNLKIFLVLGGIGLGCALIVRGEVTPAIAVGGGAVQGAPSGRFIALMIDGTIWGWGYNGNGEIGDGSGATVVARKVPVVVPNFTDVTAIGSGDAWGPSMAIKSDGTAWGWGIVDNLTSSDVYSTNRPMALLGGSNITAVAAGEDSMLLLNNDGTVWAGGNNRYGQFGDGTFETAAGLVQTHLTNAVRAIAATGWSGLAAKQDGTVWAWGLVGLNADNTYLYWSTPGRVAGLSNIVDVKASYPNLALKQDATVWTWAKSGGPQADAPTQVSQINNVIAIAGGDFHALALKGDGTVWSWGYGSYGQLGDGTFTNLRTTPAQVVNLSGVVAIGANSSVSAALKSDGTVWTWGANYLGELGDGTTNNQSVPVQVQQLPNLYVPRPTGVTATDGAYTDQVRLTWNAVSGAQQYQVWQSDLEDSSLATLLTTTSATQYDDTQAEANTLYYYWIKTVGTNGVSGFSAVDSGYRGTLPSVLGPLIKANGSTNDITINSADNLSITVQLYPGQYEGVLADWWIVLRANSSWYYLNSSRQWTAFDVGLLNCQPAYQGILFNLSSTELLNVTGVPAGLYTLWFAVDPRDGILNLNAPILYDSVSVTIQ